MIRNQFLFNLPERQRLVVEHVAARLIHLDGANVVPVQRPVRLSAAGEVERQALLEQRRGDHENNQQHERQVDERRDVEVAQRDQRVAL